MLLRLLLRLSVSGGHGGDLDECVFVLVACSGRLCEVRGGVGGGVELTSEWTEGKRAKTGEVRVRWWKWLVASRVCRSAPGPSRAV